MGLLYYPKTNRAQNGIKPAGSGLWNYLTEACILSAGFLLLSVNISFGQEPLLEKKISIPKQTTTLYKALNLVSEKAECFFIYNSENVQSDRTVKLHGGEQPLHRVLDDLLENTGLEYKVLGKHILIYKGVTEALPAHKEPASVSPNDSVEYVVVRGHIFDSESRKAIPYATVGIQEVKIGTITNNDGYFLLKIPASLTGTSLVVSHLGYMSQRIPVQLINDQQVDLYLDRRIISIQEVIIRYIDPKVILGNAMDRRKMNYAIDPVYMTAFYREGVEKNDKYISYSEAVFKVYKSPYSAGERADQVKLLKSRKIQDTNPRDTVYLKLKAGVQSALELDIVKSIPGFLDQRPPAEYNYSYSGMVSYDQKDAYAIGFEQIAGLKKALYKGTLYIEKESFALLGADFEINPDFLDLAADDLVLKKSIGVKLKLEKIKYSVSYMPFSGRYYLRHVRCDMQLKTRLRNHLSWDDFYTFLELGTCDIDTDNVVKFPKQEVLKPGVVFSDQPYRPDDAFWGGFNIITPETKLTEALSKIIGKIEEIK